MEEQSTLTSKGSSLSWLVAVLIVLLIVGGVSVFYLVTRQNQTESTATSTTSKSTQTRTDVSGTETTIKSLASDLSKEMSAITEDQKSDEDTISSDL